MIPTSFLRRGYISAIAACVAWALLSGDSIVRPEPASYRDVLFLIPWALTAITLVWLQRSQHRQAGRLGRYAFRLTLGSMTIGGLALVAVLLGAEALLFLAFPVGVLGWIIGMALMGIATLRAGVLARRAGLALLLSEPAAILTGLALSPWVPLADSGSYSGGIANGVAILVVGLAMRKAEQQQNRIEIQDRRARVHQPAETGIPSLFS